MRLTLERSSLLKSLSHVHRVVERRHTIPILANVLLKAANGTLVLKATDLDLEAQETVPAQIEQEGATTVAAYTLYDIIRKLPEGVSVGLEANTDKGTLTVSAGRSRFALQILPESDFPDITTGAMTHRFSLKARAVKTLIERTQFAISVEEIRYYLNGIFLHTVETENGPRLRAVATDGHRLARADVAAPEGSATMPGVIIPRKTVAEIQRLIEDPEADVAIELSESKIRLGIGAVVITSKLIDGTFPDYARVIPQNNEREMRVERGEFIDAVDRVSTIASERGRAVKLSLAPGRLVLTVINPDSGSATEELTVDYDQAPFDIGFNARYLLDIAGQLESETALFRFADSASPTLIQNAGEESETLYVLMPMRV